MKQFKTQAIVLRRVNYGEADRIITFLTNDHGKVSAIAKGVRRPKSKLSGGLEPFSDSTISFGQGRGELHLVLSTRLERFYKNILSDYDRLQLGYEAIKLVDRSTEDIVDASFFDLLQKTFAYLDAPQIATGFVELWFRLQLEDLLGRAPNLHDDASGQKLTSDGRYVYDIYERGLVASEFGSLGANHIKLLRLAREHSPVVLAGVKDSKDLLGACLDFVRQLGA